MPGLKLIASRSKDHHRKMKMMKAKVRKKKEIFSMIKLTM
jgi:hypothetical protein